MELSPLPEDLVKVFDVTVEAVESLMVMAFTTVVSLSENGSL